MPHCAACARVLCLHLPFPYLIAHLDKARLSCCLPPTPSPPLLPHSPLNPSCPHSPSLCYSLACHCLLPLLTSIFIAFHVFNVACRNFLRCFCSLLFVAVVVVVSCHLCNSLLNSRLQRDSWRWGGGFGKVLLTTQRGEVAQLSDASRAFWHFKWDHLLSERRENLHSLKSFTMQTEGMCRGGIIFIIIYLLNFIYFV